MSSNPAPTSDDAAEKVESAVSADELLPPVEPPNAGFILQLFVVPGLIVLGVFLLVLVLGWVRSSQEDPLAKVQALRAGNQSRWQQAFELAQMMASGETRFPGLKQNVELVREVAALLDEEVDAARSDDNSINLRYYLCRILGEFQVDDGLSVLLKTAREDAHRDVRREAINAIAVLGYTFQTLQPPRPLRHPELTSTMVQLANESDELLRSQAAYAIGVLVQPQDADETLLAELRKLADDLYADARYNAAIALARRGDPYAAEAIAEMLDPDAIAISIASEQTAALQAFKRDTILRNALEGARLLLEKNAHLDLVEVTDALERFANTASQWQKPAAVPKSLVEQAKTLVAKTGRSSE